MGDVETIAGPVWCRSWRDTMIEVTLSRGFHLVSLRMFPKHHFIAGWIVVDETWSCAIVDEVLTWLRTNTTGKYRRPHWITCRRWLGGSQRPFPSDLPPTKYPTVPAVEFEHEADAALFRIVWGQ